MATSSDPFLDTDTEFDRTLSPSDDLRLESSCTQHKDPTPSFSLASQTIIFFDWDDTLFPTTEFTRRWNLGSYSDDDLHFSLTHEQREDLKDWQSALFELMNDIRQLGKCVILTNSNRPWVTDCIRRFAPQVMHLFDRPDGPEIVYAPEHVRATKPHRARSLGSSSPCRFKTDTSEEFYQTQTFCKFVAMRDKVAEFYSKYHGQTWKNVLSFGDMPYEFDAVQDVTFRHKAPTGKQEIVRTKSFLLRSQPEASEIALRLKFHKAVLPAYVHFDGDIRLDLTEESDPLVAISNALDVPELSPISPTSPLFPNSPLRDHQWGLGPKPQKNELRRGRKSTQRELSKIDNIVSAIVSL